jgi:hypothetical protein
MTWRRPRFAGAIILALLPAMICWGAGTEKPVKAVLPPEGKFAYLERADLRRYESGRFVGLEHHEVRGVLQRTSSLSADIEGTFYVMQMLDHVGAETSQQVQQTIPVSYAIQPDGAYSIEGDGAYPTLRGFPVIPVAELSAGDRWTGIATRLVDPLHDGKFSRTRFLADYRYKGEVTQGGKTSKAINATYAVRYRNGEDPAGDIRLKSVSGNHDVAIQLSVPSGAISFMRDQMDETYAFTNGTSVRLKGFILTWFTPVAPLNRAETADAIAKKLGESGTKNVIIEQKKEGLSVSLKHPPPEAVDLSPGL